MWLIALKGLSGSGKSTLGRALGKQLGWPLIDKDDVKDILDGYTAEGSYPITNPLFVVDTVRPFQECLVEVVDWIEQLLKSP
jgi:tRNA uridine 5-carbamoylmethylation protein Kti12